MDMSAVKTALLIASAAAVLSACATPQTNPHYKYSSKLPTSDAQSYPSQAPVTYQAAHTTTQNTYVADSATREVVYAQTYPVANAQPASVQSANYTQNASAQTYQSASADYQDCMAREQNYKIGGAVIGGAIGAYGGKKLGGDDNETLGMVAGAALGGTAGYGAGDVMVNCAQQAPAPISQPLTQTYPANAQTAPVYTSQTNAVEYAPVIPAQQATVSQAQIIAPQPAAQLYQEPSVITETSGQNLSNYTYNSGGYVSNAAVTLPAPMQAERQITMRGPVSATIQSATTAGEIYIVQEGDTAWSLSRKVCATTGQIRQMNSLEGDFLIKAGEAIRLPANQC